MTLLYINFGEKSTALHKNFQFSFQIYIEKDTVGLNWENVSKSISYKLSIKGRQFNERNFAGTHFQAAVQKST